jgi:exopolysaccharide biosynthesis polyprenyl glycosylphosphotransferase
VPPSADPVPTPPHGIARRCTGAEESPRAAAGLHRPASPQRSAGSHRPVAAPHRATGQRPTRPPASGPARPPASGPARPPASGPARPPGSRAPAEARGPGETSRDRRRAPDLEYFTAPGRRRGPAHRRGQRRWEVHYVARTAALDLAVGLIAASLAFDVRFGEVTEYNRGYLWLSALLPLGLLLALAVNRAYERRLLYVGTEEYQRVLGSGLALTATVAVASYALSIDVARGYVVIALPVATAACVAMRFANRKLLHAARRRGECLRRVVVVGHELAVVGLTRQLRRERYHGLDVVGACLPPRHDGRVGDLTVYGTFDDVARAVVQAAADTVIVLTCPEFDGVSLRRLAWQLERDDVDLIVANNLIDVAGARTTIRPVDGLPMLHVEHPTLSGARRVAKAVFDRVGAALLLTAFAPVLLAVAVAVRLDSPGPVLFRQVRVGRYGREFQIYKFRTMHVDAERRLAELRHLNEQDAVLFKIRDDPRVTRVGRYLRRLSLDELPQLFNVLGGTMSLVGPRPPLRSEVAAYPADARRRLAVRPGMTGLWQVSGRSDLPWEEAVRLDLRYVENWSLSLDLVILLRTLTAVWRGAGAY